MKLLLCSSDYFRIEYEINPWMKISDNADAAQVLKQYQVLKDTILSTGIEVEEILPDKLYPDMVYTANYGFIQGKKFIQANFKYEQRRGEAGLASEYFREKGFEIHTLPQDIYFEGEGDLLKNGNRYFLGHGKRTMQESAPYLEKILQSEIIPLKLVDPYYYHLDTCFAPLTADTVIVNPESFTVEGMKLIRSSFKNIIHASKEDNKVLACNLVKYKNHIITGKGITEQLKKYLQDFGYQVHEVPMSQYIKGGGSVKCCSLIVEE